MKQVNTAMYAQTLYMLILGLSLLLVPNLMLPVLGFAPPQDFWVRVLGALLIGFSYYYYTCTQHELLPFYWATIRGVIFSAPH